MLVGSVSASDSDLSPSFSGFTITSGNGSGFFSINSATGALVITGNVDYETTTSYTLGLTVSDGTFTSVAGNITINVVNLNDSPPIVTSGQSFSLNENQAIGTSVGTILATDPDTGSPTLSNWSIVSGNTGGAFNINPATGEITSNIVLDRESTASYSLGIRVSDGTLTSATQTVTVSLTDVNDNTPVIASGQALTVAENTSTGTTLAGSPITVSDADASTTYSGWSIVSGNTGTVFSINASTGVISTSAALDRETIASYSLGIQVSDGTNTSSVENLIINISDINDNPPVITAGQVFTIIENAANGTTLTGPPIAVTDPDGSSSFSSWSIVSGNTGNVFSINSSTGIISKAGVIDREGTPSYTLGIQVSDGGQHLLSSNHYSQSHRCERFISYRHGGAVVLYK